MKENKKEEKPKMLPFTVYLDITLDKKGIKKAHRKKVPVVDNNIKAMFQELEETLNRAINSAHIKARGIYGYVTANVTNTKNFHVDY